jgi:hypothetical protein
MVRDDHGTTTVADVLFEIGDQKVEALHRRVATSLGHFRNLPDDDPQVEKMDRPPVPGTMQAI